MVHLFCQNGDCRTLIHLDDVTHWNYKGKIKCEKCGTIIEIEIRNGEVIKAKRIQ